jgi:hypothetical protein
MITFLVAAGHRKTHRRLLAGGDGPPVSVRCYHELFARRRIGRGTYVFTDFDRLDFWELELAAEAFRVIRTAGATALNDPARVRQRYALLRAMQREGINRFGAYRIEAGEMPERYPVFLRNESAHGGALTDLLPDADALHAATDDLVTKGVPVRHLIAVEYAAEPLEAGIFRKMAAFRIGDRIAPTPSVHDRSWKAKIGERGLAGEVFYEEENEFLRSNPYRDVLMRAFSLANIEYGRADFGVVEGAVQVYEINTNPALPGNDVSHPSAMRRDSRDYSWNEYLAGLHAIDTSGGPAIVLDTPKLAQRRRRQLWRLSDERLLSTP